MTLKDIISAINSRLQIKKLNAMQEAIEKYNMTRDQIYHYVKTYGISKIKVGRIVKISKQELDNLFSPPKI